MGERLFLWCAGALMLIFLACVVALMVRETACVILYGVMCK